MKQIPSLGQISLKLNCMETQPMGPYVWKINIEFCITCFRGHSADHMEQQLDV